MGISYVSKPIDSQKKSFTVIDEKDKAYQFIPHKK